MSPKPADPRAERECTVSLSGVPVKLVVGEKEDIIFVHPSILSKTSKFFKAAVKKEWLEEPSRTIKLPADDIDTITAYTQWLYTGTIFSKSKEPAVGYPPARNTQYEQYILCANLYVLGEKIVDVELQNTAVDAIIATTHDKIGGSSYYPIGKAVNIIYENTPKDSPARLLLVHIWNDVAGPRWMTEWNDVKLHRDFLEDITLALLQDRQRAENAKVYNSSRVLDAQAYYKSDQRSAKTKSTDESKESDLDAVLLGGFDGPD